MYRTVSVMVKSAMLIAIFVSGWVCKAQANEDQKALASFKALVDKHVHSYGVNGRQYVQNLGGGWATVKFALVPSSVKFDVEKTTSLVTPYTGIVTFTVVRSISGFHTTAAEAAGDKVFVSQTSEQHTHRFGFQDQRWQPTKRVYEHADDRLDGTEFPCDEFLSKPGAATERDIHGCLEEFD